MKNYNIETSCLHAGYRPKDGEPRVFPIVQSTTFTYDSMDTLADLFDLKTGGHFYSRLSNPTCDALEQKVAALEGGVGALATSSGQAATMLAICNVCSAGDHLIATRNIYGGTYNLLDVTLRKLGIRTTFVDSDAKTEDIEKHIEKNTKIIFGETVANPACNVLDFDKFAKISKKHNLLFVVDNTLATAVLCKPFELGANIIVYSSTKYLDGHAVALGGLIVDGGNFDYSNDEKFACLNTPDPSYHGINYAKDCGKIAYIIKARVQLMRDMGACQSPMNAFLTNLGIETLHLRMERTCENALALARFLKNHKKVEFVKYAGLEGDKSFDLGKKYLPKGCGGMVVFGTVGGKEAAKEFISKLSLIRQVTHVADLRTCVINPASTTHRQLSPSDLHAAGITENLVRLSVGIENVNDLIADLENALK